MIGLRQSSCVLANGLLAGAIVLFAAGFFPHKAFMSGLAEWPSGQASSAQPAPFDKVIVMVVDALRSDFVYSPASRFLFTQSLIQSGAAIPFTGHASAPTVTMPKIKAITTGSVPSFLDVLLNFAESDTTSTLAHQDSWLAQMKQRSGKKLVMYGDDTWLKLFPDFFDRAEGTTSFFVSDFTEVDHNVTRNVPFELAQDDWSLMVLHYLGLDHIGHKSGPQSVNMPPKQREMDEMVKEIYGAMENNSHLGTSLLILCGDHGMNEAGNHGGSSSGEVSTAMTFISPKFKAIFPGQKSPTTAINDYSFYQTVEQSDITPTLSILLGVPIPLNSLGVVIIKLLRLWANELDQVSLVHANAQQIAHVANITYAENFQQYSSGQACEDPTSDAAVLPCSWLRASRAVQDVARGDRTAAEAIELNMNFMLDAQKQLTGNASNYDLIKMAIGVMAALLSLVLAIMSVPSGAFSRNAGSMSFALVLTCHFITMFASSYVEEEHQFWYWALSGWLTYLSTKEQRLIPDSSVLPIRKAFLPCISALYGVARRVNSTGQKYAALPCISSAIFHSEPWLLWCAAIVMYAIILQRLTRRAAKWGEAESRRLTLLPIPACVAGFAFKVAFASAESPELLEGFPVLKPLVALTSRYALVGQARVVFLGIAHMLACALYYESPWKKKDGKEGSEDTVIYTCHHLLTLFLLTQSRVTNVPLFLLFSVQLSCLRAQPGLLSNPTEITLTFLLFQQCSFYALGGTNAISSIDLSNAYNGISGYNVLLVGILTFVGNWAGPIWWASGTAIFLSDRAQEYGHQKLNGPQVLVQGNSFEQAPTSKGWIGTSVEDRKGRRNVFFTLFAVLTVSTTAGALGVMVACTVLREHLFIWTVFSPKYLYVAAWTFGQHLLVNGAFTWAVLMRADQLTDWNLGVFIGRVMSSDNACQAFKVQSSPYVKSVATCLNGFYSAYQGIPEPFIEVVLGTNATGADHIDMNFLAPHGEARILCQAVEIR